MSFIQREIQKLEVEINRLQPVISEKIASDSERELYNKLYAARQALSWSLEPQLFKSPFYMILDLPTPDHEKAPLAEINV